MNSRILRAVRRGSFLNSVVRTLIVKNLNLLNALSDRWRVAGRVPLTFDGKSFVMHSKCDDGIVNQLFYGKQYIEFNDLKVFNNLIRPGFVVFDIGANTGIYSITSAKTNEEVEIHSFEPNPINHERLKQNVVSNKLKNVVIVNKALGSSNSTISFTVPEEDIISDTSSPIESFSKASYRGEIEWRKIEVEQYTLDAYIAQNQIKRLDLIKIDVEGYEINVLQGAEQAITQHKPIILIESFLDPEKKKFLESMIIKNGYYVYIIVTEGIINMGQVLNSKVGLNFLLMPFKTGRAFISMGDLSKLGG